MKLWYFQETKIEKNVLTMKKNRKIKRKKVNELSMFRNSVTQDRLISFWLFSISKKEFNIGIIIAKLAISKTETKQIKTNSK